MLIILRRNNFLKPKQVCHLLILAAANEPDLGLLVVNTLTKVKYCQNINTGTVVFYL